MLWGYNTGFWNSPYRDILANYFARSRTRDSAPYPKWAKRIIPMAAERLYRRSTFAGSAMIYFQFVFAAITPLLIAGSVLRPHEFQGLDGVRSGVEHARVFDRRVLDMGRRLALTVGRRRLLGWLRHPPWRRASPALRCGCRRRAATRLKISTDFEPNNLIMAFAGAGILWLGWNGFNGGDPYYR